MFENFPDSSRIWIFGLRNELAGDDLKKLKSSFSVFNSEWLSHKERVRGDFSILHSRFLVFVADQDVTHVSGCSTDSLFRKVREEVSGINNELASPLEVFYKNQDQRIELVKLADFKEQIKNAEISEDTIIFQNSIQSLAEFREVWESPASKSRLRLRA